MWRTVDLTLIFGFAGVSILTTYVVLSVTCKVDSC